MTAEIIPLNETPMEPPRCSFCRKEIPKGALALRSLDGAQWMCRGCIQEASLRLGIAA